MAKHAVSGVSGNTLNDTQLEVLRIGISDLAPALRFLPAASSEMRRMSMISFERRCCED
ncbi:hypothetical protein AGTUEHA105_LOCUS4905 [Agrobacterium tumefaciens]|jgi:hypothetical protein|nr:hypothetical protein AGTUEHA105_LOCUS4905 [Agrobacterium tumefaciens]